MTMAQAVPKGYFAKNIDAAGDPGLKGKPAFKLAMQEKTAASICPSQYRDAR